jgi:hypothetical protein
LIIATTILVSVNGTATDADSLPIVTSCTPTATTAVGHPSTGVYSLTITDAVAGTSYVLAGTVTVSGVTYTWSKSLTAPAGGGTTTLADAIALVRTFARNAANSSVVTDAEIVTAIQTVLDMVGERLKQPLTSATVTLTAASAAFTVSATAFRPDLIKRAYIVGETAPMDVVDLDDVLFETAYSGTPARLCFTSFTAGLVYPTPSAEKTMKLYYRQPMPTFSAASGSVVIPLPDDLIRLPLIYGATALLQHTDPEAAYASESWGKFQQWLASHGSGMGVKFDVARLPEN